MTSSKDPVGSAMANETQRQASTADPCGESNEATEIGLPLMPENVPPKFRAVSPTLGEYQQMPRVPDDVRRNLRELDVDEDWEAVVSSYKADR